MVATCGTCINDPHSVTEQLNQLYILTIDTSAAIQQADCTISGLEKNIGIFGKKCLDFVDQVLFYTKKTGRILQHRKNILHNFPSYIVFKKLQQNSQLTIRI